MAKVLTLFVAFSLTTAPLDPIIAFAAFKDGNWDLYALKLDSGTLFRLTSHPAEDRDPAFSSDGKKLAFSARRDGNWDIYVLDEKGKITRLTSDPHYDGKPSWSPDGRYIAFESFRARDLDIWLMRADGSDPRNLTADSPYGEAEPAWSPDGRFLAFTSWRFGDKDIFLLDMVKGQLIQLTTEVTDEYSLSWSPDGKKLAFVREENGQKAVWVIEIDSKKAYRLSWLSAEDSPLWLPDGRIAFIHYRYDGERLMLGEERAGSFTPVSILGPVFLKSGLSAAQGLKIPGEEMPVLSLKTLPSSNPGAGTALEELPGVKVYDPRLSNRVIESFLSLKERVRNETGYDFLGRLSEAFRPLDFRSDHAEYTSWHKAGRAFDIYFETDRLLIAREEMGGETWWRVYLRCARQDGSCGEPLRQHPWALSYNPGEEGIPEFIPNGYYVDFTLMAREAGWERIPAHRGKDFDWRWKYEAMEFWHYQRREGLVWYRAMEQIHPPEKLRELFSWDRAAEAGVSPYLMKAKGIDIPADKAFWLRLSP